jgi:hypothetical protein
MGGQIHAPSALPLGTHRIGGWVDPRGGLDDVEKRIFLTLQGLELQPLGRPARSQSLYWLRYPGSRQVIKVWLWNSKTLLYFMVITFPLSSNFFFSLVSIIIVRSKLIKLPCGLCTCVNVPFRLLLWSVLTDFHEVWYEYYVPGKHDFLISYRQ